MISPQRQGNGETSMRYLSTTFAAFAIMTSAPALAQETPPPPPPAPAQEAPTAPAGQDWNAVSRSATRVYMVDVNSLKTMGDVTSITLARVPLSPETPGDQTHVTVEMEYRCRAKESRALAETEHDATGAPMERFEMGEAFTPYDAQSLDSYVAVVACEGARAAPPTYPSIKAFIDAGRR